VNYISYKSKKNEVYKTVIGDVVAHLNLQKNSSDLYSASSFLLST